MKNKNIGKIGVFHWSFDELGGGEILAAYLGKALNTRVYSIIKDQKMNELGFIDISSRVPLISKILRKFRSFDYLVWSNVDVREFDDFDMIITSGLTARALITPDNVMHVHYNHSPARWLYDLWHYRRKSKGWFKQNILLPLASEFFRIWDETVDKRVDYYISNSPITQKRLWKYLKRDSVVLYPPIELEKYKMKEPEDFYLFAGRLWHEKRPEEAIKACIKANKKLVVIGSGFLEDELKKKYNSNPLIDIRGFVSEEEKIDLFSRCKAVIYPCVAEDFGIVPIEAFASGKPVICSEDGFPPLIVNEERGIAVDCSNYKLIAEAIYKLENSMYDPHSIRDYAKQFDFSVFKSKLKYYLSKFYEDFKILETGDKHD